MRGPATATTRTDISEASATAPTSAASARSPATADALCEETLRALQRDREALERRGRELQEALSELRQAQEQLLQRERLAAVGQVAGRVAHEINNPACYVQTNLRALREALAGGGPLDVAEMREMVEESLQGMARIASLVRDLGGCARDDRREARDRRVEPVGVAPEAAAPAYSR